MPNTDKDKPQKRAVKAVAKEEKKTSKAKKAPVQTEAQPVVEPVVPKKLTKKEQAAIKAAEKKLEKGKKRVKKDKNAPKKPMSPFFCYQAKRRPQIKAVTPEISNNDIISNMAAEWRGLSTEDQAPFVLETEAHKKRYQIEKKAYDEKKKIEEAEKAAAAEI